MSGFLFNELSEFKQDLFREIEELFPEETDKFLFEEAKKFKKEVQKVAKKNVKAHELHTRFDEKKQKDVSTNYHKNFKIGKKYVRGESRCLRVYNAARHAHLIEYGHVIYNKSGGPYGFTLGKFVFKEAELNFESQFKDDVEKFLYNSLGLFGRA